MLKKIGLLITCLMLAICAVACSGSGGSQDYTINVEDMVVAPGEQVMIIPEFSDGKSHDFTLTVMEGGYCITLSGKTVQAKETGVATLKATSGSASVTFTVTVNENWKILFDLPEQITMGKPVQLTASASEQRETDFAFSVKEQGKATIVDDVLTATEEGELTVVCKDLISGRQVEVTTTVVRPNMVITATDVTISQDQNVTIPVSVANNFDDLPVECQVVGGDGEIQIQGESIIGISVGQVQVLASVVGTELSAMFTVTVTARQYVIEISDMTAYAGDRITPQPVITPAVYEVITYTVKTGHNVIGVDGETLVAKAEGKALVELTIDDGAATKLFNVTVAGYQLEVYDVQVFAGEFVSPNPILTPAAEAEYEYTVVSGGQYIEVLNSKIRGKKQGTGTVRCTAVGKNVSCEFEVKVTECKINVEGATLIVGESYTPEVTVEPEYPGSGILFLPIDGQDCVKISGGTITALKTGTSTVRCYLDGTSFYADIQIKVINYEITASDFDLYDGDVVDVNAVVTPQKELTYEIIEGEDVAAVDKNGTLSARKKGSATLRITATGTDVYKDVTVLVRAYTITASDLEMLVLDSAVITPTVTPEKGRTVTYEIKSGEDVVSVEGARVTAIAPGEAEIRVSVEGVDAHVDVKVKVGNYEIIHSNVGLYVGLETTLQPKSSPEKNFSYSYEIVSGQNVVRLNGATVVALSEGEAEIKISAIEVPASKIVKVIVADYAISVADMRLYVGDHAQIEPTVVPEKQDATFNYEVISGAECVDFSTSEITGIKPGTVVIRCSMYGSSATFDFTVLVEHEMQEVPKGYVKISEHLYATQAAGRYKEAKVIDFFTPYKRAKLYYTTDGTPFKQDYTYASVWQEAKWMQERRGSYNDYTLTQQVDAALTWAGGSKNSSPLYISNAQNGGKYNFINLAYVYNVAVVLGGEIIDTATQTYVIYSGSEFDNMPIISLSMDPDKWFDGIANGLGESVYNNVYKPGSNAQNEKTARANLEFLDVNGDGFEVNTQVKVGGGWSRGRPQRTLHLNFLRDENGVEQGYVEYEIYGDQYTTQDDPTESLNTFSRFRLHNGGSTYDSYTRMNDAIIQNLSRGLDVSTTAWRPAVVYLNGEFWGTYHLREHYADVYFKENYDVKKGNVQYYDYTSGRYNVSDGDVTSATAFINEMNAFLNNSQKNFADDAVCKEFFDKYVDEQSLIDLVVIQTFMGNWDWVGNGNNHRAWRTQEVEEGNPYTDGKLRFCLHDLDFGMAASATDSLMISMYPPGRETYSSQEYLLLNRALANEGFRQRMYERAEYILENYFNYDRACQIIDQMVAAYEPTYYVDMDRWWKPQTYTAWKNAIAGAKSWIKSRLNFFLPELKRILALDEIPEMDASALNVIYSNERFMVNEFYEGNGSISDKRFVLDGLSLDNYSIEYYAVRNGSNGIHKSPFFIKLRYGTENNNQNIVIRFNDNDKSTAYVNVKQGTNSAVYSGNPGGKRLWEGVHKIKIVKTSTSFSLYINDAHITTVTLPDVVANAKVTTIDIYQHSSNMIYRNFVIKKL